MKTKKIILNLIFPILILGLFTGCSFGEDKKPTDIEKENPTIIEIQNDITEIYKKISYGCVGIYATSNTSGSTGSGVVYKEVNGLYYVVTNYHVIEGMDKVRVYRGGSRYLKASVIGGDPKNDIAVLTFSLDLFGGDEVYVNEIFSYDEEIVSVGQTVLAIGCPLGLENYNSLSTGVVSRIGKGIIQTNAEINPGNSGGGLFNASGRLIGINTEKEVYTQSMDENGVIRDIPVEGLGFAISLDVVKKCITDIEDKKTAIERPTLGIQVIAVNRYLTTSETSPYVEYLPNTLEEALVVAKVNEGVAKKAGLKTHDVILTVKGNQIVTLNDLSYELNLSLVGETFEMEVYRPSTQEKVKVQIIL
ncbi:MAG: trypsin-like peptidase domain-containing protein [Anaeroplasmataceae bacterium]|nr:trypsin-like peptidase domain-containing protein [Anaeroplasmataceae bacterium]